MTIDQRTEGVWWLPRLPEERLPGVLTISPDGRVHLDVRGAFRELPPKQHEFILGTTDRHAEVSLHHCAQTTTRRFRTAPGIACEFSVGVAFLGAHFPSADDARFTAVHADLAGLLEWLAPAKRLKIDYSSDETAVVISAQAGKIEVAARLDDLTITLATSGPVWRKWEDRRVVVEEHAVAKLASVTSETINFYLQALYNLQNFIALGLGKPTDLRSLYAECASVTDELTGDAQVPRQIAVHFERVPATLRSSPSRTHGREVFTLDEVGDEFEDVVRKWFTQAKALRSVHDLFFAAYHGPVTREETRFLNLAQALESYHRRVHGGKYVDDKAFRDGIYKMLIRVLPPDLPRDYRDALTGRLKYQNEFSLRKRLDELITLLAFLPSYFLERVADSLVRSVVDARNYFTHFDEELRKAYENGPSLWVLIWFMETVLELHFLRGLGFSDEVLAPMIGVYGRYSRFIEFSRLIRKP